MSYIYKIVNKVNNKVYIGKTNLSIIGRWKQHLNEYQKSRSNKRPLYDAMSKYGVDNFEIELLEETKDAGYREMFFIQQYRSYVGFENSNGYNATLGGDGNSHAFSTTVEVEVLVQLYHNGLTVSEISIELNRDIKTISTKLRELGFEVSKGRLRHKGVAQIDKHTNQVVAIYKNANDAAQSLGDVSKRRHITETCKHKRNSAYGFKWEYTKQILLDAPNMPPKL